MTTITFINNTIVLCVAIHHTFLLLYHSYNTFKCCIKIESGLIQHLSVVVLLINFISVSNMSILTWNWYPLHWSCHWIMITTSILYLSTKLSVYILISERLFFIFSDSQLTIKRMYILISRVLFLIYFIAISIIFILFGGGVKGSNNCELRVPPWILPLIAFGDIFICTTISIIFARRLLLLNLKLSENKNNHNNVPTNSSTSDTISRNRNIYKYKLNVNDMTWKIVTKSTLLTIIALITTPLSIIILVFFGAIGAASVSIDSTVNCYCVILLFTKHEPIYKCLCKSMESCVSIQCVTCYSCACCRCCGCIGNSIETFYPLNIRSNIPTKSPQTTHTVTTTSSTNNSSNAVQLKIMVTAPITPKCEQPSVSVKPYRSIAGIRIYT
eukprot:285811_1